MNNAFKQILDKTEKTLNSNKFILRFAQIICALGIIVSILDIFF